MKNFIYWKDRDKKLSRVWRVDCAVISNDWGWLIDGMVFIVSTIFELRHSGHCASPCFPGVLLTSTLLIILSKLLSYVTIVETMERNKSCRNDFHRFSKWILAKPEDWTSDLTVLKSSSPLIELLGLSILLRTHFESDTCATWAESLFS